MGAVTPPKTLRTRSGLLVALLDPDVATVSLPQVITRAGVSQGTFYNYFDSLPDALDGVAGLLLAEHAADAHGGLAGRR